MKEQLSNAIVSGNLEFLKTYINEGNDFNEMLLKDPNGYGELPLGLAVISQINYEGSAEVTQLILENSNEKDQAQVLVGFASEDTYLEKMKVLLETGIAVDLVFKNQTALQRATGNGNLKMVHLLLMYGADPNKNGEYGTALEAAKKIHYDRTYQQMMTAFMNGEKPSPFDFINKDEVISQLKTMLHSLKNFGKNNKNHTFYVVAIDDGQLKANSEEKFTATLKKYQEKYPNKYYLENAIKSLKFNPGDFSFHIETESLDDLNTSVNLDLTFLEKQENENRTKKDLLFEGLIKNKEIFTCEMNTTDDFEIISERHTY